MAGFSDIGKKIGAIAGNASKKSGSLVETARLNSEINRLELDIEDIQFELGRAYYEANKDDPVSPYAEYISKIREYEQEIRANEERILALKGMRHCPACASIEDAADEFCGKCGARMPTDEANQEKTPCKNCGELCGSKDGFCPSCGFIKK